MLLYNTINNIKLS